MYNHTSTDHTPLLDQATQAAKEGLGNASHAASEGLDRANHVVQQRLQALREGSQHLRDQALHAGERTTHYIRDEPVKSVLIAAAAGAALVALLSLFGRSHRHH